jgi:hypothetical protein
MTESDDPADIARRLAELRQEHRELDSQNERLSWPELPHNADELTLKRLKKHRLWLKDCIARLQSALIPDEPA